MDDRFRKWRLWRGQSQSELASALGVSQALVSQIERGSTRVAKIDLARRIEDASRDWPEGPISIREWSEPASGAA